MHEIAEELEHIKSEKLIDELDAFLEFPTHDPHGDPIPDKEGNFTLIEKIILAKADIGITYKCIGVDDTSVKFLQYLDSNTIGLGTLMLVKHKEPFDNSIKLEIEGKEVVVSQNVAKNLYIKKV